MLGGIKYTGGGLVDDLTIQASTISLLGGLSATLGAGVNSVDISASSGIYVGLGVTVAGLNGTDTFEWSGGGIVVGKFSVNLGIGIGQSALITGGLSIGKGLAISGIGTGNSAANITLSQLAISGTSAISLGNGADVVNIDGVHFLGKTTISTGVGADSVKIERAGSVGVTTFGGTASIFLGDGADTLEVSSVSANDMTRFAVKWFADGGAGVNLATLSATNVFEPFGHQFKSL